VTLLGPYLVACALLAIAGSSKAARPRHTATVLVQLFPSLRPLAVKRSVRVFALAEALLGVVSALFPYPALAAAVAGSYLGFALFVLYLRARVGASADCGCISADGASTRLHILVNLAMAASAASVAWAGAGRWIFSVLSNQVLDGVPLIAACAACSWLLVLSLVALPRLSAAREALQQRSTGAV
jgi:hypothetical protein